MHNVEDKAMYGLMRFGLIVSLPVCTLVGVSNKKADGCVPSALDYSLVRLCVVLCAVCNYLTAILLVTVPSAVFILTTYMPGVSLDAS